MEVNNKVAITMIVIDDIAIGNHTGAIQGRGIKNNTSIVVNLGGHFINKYKER